MKFYRDIRAKKAFLDICKDKDLVTEITVRAQRVLKTDAAIIFADILLIVEPMGLSLAYLKGDGPSIGHAVRTRKDIENLSEVDPKESLSFMYGAIRQTRAELDPEIPLIGFAGAPFTLASYIIEGGSSDNFNRTKMLIRSHGSLWKLLMEKISRATVKYLNGQIEAGVEAVQLFDSWVGCLTAAEYKKSVWPYSRQVIRGIKKGTPVIHFGTGTSHFLELFAQAGGDVVSVDHRVGLAQAWKKIGHDRAIQGNLDPRVLCGPLSEIKKHVRRILKEAAGRPGHIFNLGHGVLPETPEKNAVALVEMVHEMSLSSLRGGTK